METLCDMVRRLTTDVQNAISNPVIFVNAYTSSSPNIPYTVLGEAQTRYNTINIYLDHIIRNVIQSYNGNLSYEVLNRIKVKLIHVVIHEMFHIGQDTFYTALLAIVEQQGLYDGQKIVKKSIEDPVEYMTSLYIMEHHDLLCMQYGVQIDVEEFREIADTCKFTRYIRKVYNG
jgi:hypothetical protein